MSADSFELDVVIEDIDKLLSSQNIDFMDLPDWMLGDNAPEQFCLQVVKWLRELKVRRETESGGKKGLYLL